MRSFDKVCSLVGVIAVVSMETGSGRLTKKETYFCFHEIQEVGTYKMKCTRSFRRIFYN